MYEIILFDLDGTLTDPAEGITNSVMYALGKWGITVTDRRELYRFIGPPLKDSFMEYYGFSPENAERAVEEYRVYFRETGKFENAVYPGIERLLCNLHDSGKYLAVATSKPEEFARQILEHFGLARYFDVIAGATMDGSRSQKADVMEYAIKQIPHFDRRRAVMVGDRRQDVNGANACLLDSIGVLYGYGDRAEHEAAGATFIVDTVGDLAEFLLSPNRPKLR